MESSNTGPYGVGSPFTLPPFESLPPVTLPDTSPSPPYCVNPPSTPQTPPGTLPSPTVNPPFYYVPPIFPVPSTPGSTAPSLPPPYFEPILSPPPFYFPSPPSGGGGGGGGGGLSPPIFLPPVIFPAPRAPPPPKTGGPSMALWCVAKPSVPDPIIQEAMNYACSSGADCASIQPNGLCFEPNTPFAHASYAFNSYWQRTKVAGGSCSFGGIAMLVTVDPSEFFEPELYIHLCSFHAQQYH